MPTKPGHAAHPRPHSGSQLGVALISVLITVAIVTTIASSLMYNFQRDVARVSNFVHQGRALVLALAAEEAARSILAYDLINNGDNYDALSDNWVLPIEPTELQSGGSISLNLIDLSGFLNVNNFFLIGDATVLTETNITLSLRDLYADQIKRFFASEGVTEEETQAGMVAALSDWIDSDNEVSRDQATNAQGAEDSYYRLASAPWPAYRAANQPFTNCAELQILRYFRDSERRSALEEFLRLCSALPEVVPVNVNTADSKVLSALAESMGDVDMNQLLIERVTTPFESKADFFEFLSANSPTSAETWRERLPAEMIDVRSQYFLLTSDILVGVSQVKAYAVIQRLGPERLHIIGRSFEFW